MGKTSSYYFILASGFLIFPYIIVIILKLASGRNIIRDWKNNTDDTKGSINCFYFCKLLFDPI
jgi:hypothetical protein